MKVLVTGGAGFIGSHVVDALVAAGHEVAVVDNLATGRRANVRSGIRFHEVDIRDRAALERAFELERPEVVSHQAAQASVSASMVDPIRDAEINVLGSLAVLEACRRFQVRKLVYAGTGGAAVGEPRYLPVDEEHPADPLSPYGADKHAVEHYCSLYRTNWGLETTVLRYANVYGPRQDPRGEAGVIAIFAGRMLAGGEPEPVVNGSGEQERDYVYVGDVAAANLLVLDRGDGGMFNIGTGVGTSVNTIFDRLAELTGYDRPARHGPALPGEVFRIFLSVDRAREALGWEPTVTLDDGLRRTVQSMGP
jgi:UDP-glucose 4-epimerase